MAIFSSISAIKPNISATWQGRVFLSFDIDWAHDEVIIDTINLVSDSSVPVTWFVTHDTPILKDMRNSRNAELGIHPNFNPLLDGSASRTDLTCDTIIDELLSIVPEARCIRSHSLTQNEKLLDKFKSSGLTHISNFLIPHGCGVEAKPYHLWDDMIIVPHCWQDNVAIKMPLGFPIEEELATGFHVFDFHPIHVFLNTEHLHRYERTRHLHQKPDELIKYRYEGYGTRSRLLELLSMVQERTVAGRRCKSKMKKSI